MIGVIVLGRRRVEAFTARQIELVESFADQAVIAISNVGLFNETKEALAQQTATADVLKVISRSVSDVAPVFETILESCQRLLGLELVAVYLVEGDMVRGAAQRGWKGGDWGRDVTPLAGSSTGWAIAERRPLHIPDLADKPDLPEDKRTAVREAGGVTVLYAPMLLEDRGVGSIVVSRMPAKPFSDKEIALAQSFADQAAIAIQNARMFDEVQARTREVEEALAQQTATADVLKAISRTAFDLDTVFETLITTALRLCDATYGEIFRRHGDFYRYAASRMDVDPAYLHHEQAAEIGPGRGTLVGRVALENRAVEITDAWNDPEYQEKQQARVGNVRAMLGVPLLRNGEPIGAFALGRAEPVPFTQRQIDLVTTFADQAVIAIENVRLFDEVQARTQDLTKALQQQTATADVLKVISRSAFDLDVVFDALLASAVSLFGSRGGTICVRDGDGFRYRAVAEGRDSAMWRYLSEHPPTPGPASLAGRILLSGKPEIIADTLLDSDLKVPVHSLAGSRSVAGVPLLRDNKVEGALMVGRAEAGPFDSQQIELLQTFADQAVIAIENARLFDEVQARTKDIQEALQLQTATSDVLKVISRSAFDLQIVFDTLTASAVELCGAFSGSICVRDGEIYRYRGNAGPGLSVAMSQYLAEHPATPGRGSIVGRVLLLGKVEEIQDVLEDPEYVVPLGAHGQASRGLLGVPLLGKDRIEGALVLTRKEPGRFTPRQIEIVQTFADQAVIAIENVRLFDEVQARTKELAASLDDLRKAQDRLIQSEKLASLGQLTAGIAHEIKNPLNFVNNFSALSRELVGELAGVIKATPLDDARREEADELIETIGGNLDKVVQHGKRADSIVKNMLLHSREGSGERSETNINAMVEEALNLAYHGMRAEKPGFNVTIVKSLDSNAGSADVYVQEMTRVLLNLISNGFYATSKRESASGGGAYEPTIAASTRDLGHSVEIAIRDNGIGIPDEVKAKMFNPFFTTKPAGEGTGLGLSLSHDIVVKQHGGTIEVSTEPGAYTQFTIVLPRAGAGK